MVFAFVATQCQVHGTLPRAALGAGRRLPCGFIIATKMLHGSREWTQKTTTEGRQTAAKSDGPTWVTAAATAPTPARLRPGTRRRVFVRSVSCSFSRSLSFRPSSGNGSSSLNVETRKHATQIAKLTRIFLPVSGSAALLLLEAIGILPWPPSLIHFPVICCASSMSAECLPQNPISAPTPMTCFTAAMPRFPFRLDFVLQTFPGTPGLLSQMLFYLHNSTPRMPFPDFPGKNVSRSRVFLLSFFRLAIRLEIFRERK